MLKEANFNTIFAEKEYQGIDALYNRSESVLLTRASDILIESFAGDIPMDTMIDYESLVEIVDSIRNFDGQVMIYYSFLRNEFVDDYNAGTKIVAHNMTSLREFFEDEFKIDLLKTSHGAIIKPIFEYCSGTQSSAISLYYSHIDLLARKGSITSN